MLRPLALSCTLAGLLACSTTPVSHTASLDSTSSLDSSAQDTAIDAPDSVTPATWSAQVTTSDAVSLFYSQGIARIPGGWIFSASGGLWRTDEQFTELASRDLPLPATLTALGFNHIGDIDVAAGKLYASLEQDDDARNQQAVAWFDPQTLQYVGHVLLPQHEASWVCVDEAPMIAYLADRYSDDALLRYDVLAGWKPLAPIKMSRKIMHIQGADVAQGAAWLSAADEVEGLYRVDLATGLTVQIGSVGRLVPTGIILPEVEGIDATLLPSGLLHVLTGEPLHVTSWLDHFAVHAP
jgi:hypothetical protein